MKAFAFSQRGTQVKEALREAVSNLQKAHIETASLDARILLEYVLSVSRERLLLMYDTALTPAQETSYQEIIEKRANRQPVSHLIGYREFWGMGFTVTEATLDPRPDSETVIETLLSYYPDKNRPLNILDLGTGTGCLLLALLKEFPNAQGLGTDISGEALVVARENASNNDLQGRARFVTSNWASAVEGTFDIIISNPPYIATATIAELDPEVGEFEPKLALDGGKDGLFAYRAIMPCMQALLADDGIAAFEFGFDQKDSIEELIKANGLIIETVKQDLNGIPRCVVVKKPKN